MGDEAIVVVSCGKVDGVKRLGDRANLIELNENRIADANSMPFARIAEFKPIVLAQSLFSLACLLPPIRLCQHVLMGSHSRISVTPVAGATRTGPSVRIDTSPRITCSEPSIGNHGILLARLVPEPAVRRLVTSIQSPSLMPLRSSVRLA